MAIWNSGGLASCGRAFPQCGKDVHFGLVHCFNNGEETDVDDDTCTDPGPSNYACVQGYGRCTDGTLYHTANAGPSTVCGGGCCDGTIECPRYHSCDMGTCDCVISGSPIIVDTIGKGFHLTSLEEGVTFDFFADHRPVRMSWTEAGSGNAFLALDRNRNGVIDDASELFGKVTPQPKSDHPNGYLALAEFDKVENGGNGDGIIDSRDAVYSELRLWIDANHDGISQPDELHTLPEMGVFSIGLRYREEPVIDQYGNRFRYRGTLNPVPHDGTSRDGRYTYDVFFLVAESQPAGTAPATQSRVLLFQGQAPWQLSMTGGDYRDGVLYDDLMFASFHTRNTRCHPKHELDNSGGTR